MDIMARTLLMNQKNIMIFCPNYQIAKREFNYYCKTYPWMFDRMRYQSLTLHDVLGRTWVFGYDRQDKHYGKTFGTLIFIDEFIK